MRALHHTIKENPGAMRLAAGAGTVGTDELPDFVDGMQAA
jgi:hypothetical protein